MVNEPVRSVFVALGLVAGGTLSAMAAPVPAEVPKAWDLRFTYVHPQRISVRLPGAAEPQTYWYLLYNVENESGNEVPFYPIFELMTDRMQVVPSEIGVHPAVYAAIKQRHKRTHPFLTEPLIADLVLDETPRLLGRLLPGRENARDSVAVWPQVDPKASSFTIYAGGLSGETVRIRNPKHDPSRPEIEPAPMPDGSTFEKVVNPKFFTLRKTLVIPYGLPGTETTRARSEPVPGPHKWTMR